MIDKYIIKFLGAVDKFTDGITNFLLLLDANVRKRNEDN